MKKKIALFLCALLVLGTGFVLPGTVLQLQVEASDNSGHIDDTNQAGEPSEPKEDDTDNTEGSGEPGEKPDGETEEDEQEQEDDDKKEPLEPEEPEEPETPEESTDEDKEDQEEEDGEEAEEEEFPEEEILPPARSPMRGARTTVPTGAVIVQKVIVTLDSTNENANGAEGIDPYENITISFTFEIPDTSSIPVGASVVILLPDEIVVDTDGPTYSVAIPLEDTGDIIAYVTLTEGSQEMVLTFTDEMYVNDSIDFAYFSISCRFNGSMLENGGERTILFEYDGSTFPIVVNFKGKEIGLAKEIEDQGTDPKTGALTQTWKITANSEQALVSQLVILEQLPEGLEYVGYQFEGDGMNETPSGWTYDDNSSSDGTVQFTHSGQLSDTVVIYIYTQITDMKHFAPDKSAEGHVLVENAVSLSGKDIVDLSASALASVYAGQLTKEGKYVGEDGTIQWTLFLNENGQTMSDVILYDNMPDGLILDTSSIVITTESGTLNVGSDVILSDSAATGGTLWEFRFKNDLTGKCTITYTTDVDNLKTIEDFTFTNQAYLVWGSGNTSASCDVPVSGSNGIFGKYGKGYDAGIQELKWEFRINVNKYGFTGKAIVKDDFMPGRNSGENLVQGQPTITAITSTDRSGSKDTLKLGTDYTFTVNEGEGTFTLTIENEWVDERFVLVQFSTKILSHDVVAGNDNKYFWNEAEMELEGLEYKAEDSVYATPKVLTKSCTYDYSTRTITWKLEVNPFAISGLGKVVVTDYLPENLTLLGVYKDTLDDSGLLPPGQYTHNQDQRTVRFDFGEKELDGVSVDLYLVTQVDSGFYEGNFKGKKIENKATIEMSELSKTYTVDASLSLSNTLVGKEGGFDEEMGVIAWEILVNSSAVDWEMADVVLSDPLPEGLVLDIESVRLYKYGLDEKGNEISAESVPLDLNQAVSYNTQTNLFEFTFPADALAGYRYRLFFETEVLQSGRFENDITLTGFSGVSEDSKKVINVSDGEDLSGAIASRKARITLEKADETGAPLAGAVFQLRAKDGAVLETKTTDEDGKIAFTTLLKHLTDYALYEVEAPEGYALLTDPIPVYIRKGEDGKALAETLTYTAVNLREEKTPEPGPEPGPDPTPSKPDPALPPGGSKDRDQERDRGKYRPGRPDEDNINDADGNQNETGQEEEPKGEDSGGNHYNPSTGR